VFAFCVGLVWGLRALDMLLVLY